MLGLAARVVMHGEGGNKTTIVVVYAFLLPRAQGNSSGGVSVYNDALGPGNGLYRWNSVCTLL